MSSPTANKITLLSSDGKAFEVDVAVASMSQYIKDMIEDDCADGEIYNVAGVVLSLIVDYCKKHVEFAAADGESRSKVIKTCKVVSGMIENNKKKLESGADPGIAVGAMDKMLSLFIESYEKQAGEPVPTVSYDAGEDLKAWDAKFVKVDVETLIRLIKAASYLKIPTLINLAMRELEERYKTEEDQESLGEAQWPFGLRNPIDL